MPSEDLKTFSMKAIAKKAIPLLRIARMLIIGATDGILSSCRTAAEQAVADMATNICRVYDGLTDRQRKAERFQESASCVLGTFRYVIFTLSKVGDVLPNIKKILSFAEDQTVRSHYQSVLSWIKLLELGKIIKPEDKMRPTQLALGNLKDRSLILILQSSWPPNRKEKAMFLCTCAKLAILTSINYDCISENLQKSHQAILRDLLGKMRDLQ